MSRRTLFFGVVAVMAVAVLLAGYRVWLRYVDNRLPNFADETHLFVYPETTVEQVRLYVRDSCMARRSRSVDRAFAACFKKGKLQCGHYVIPEDASSAYVARMLSHGWQTPVRLVLSGTMRDKGTIARKISSQLMLDSASVAGALSDPERLARYGFTPRTVFSLFLPDSYEMYWTVTADELLSRMKQIYDEYWTPERKSLARKAGLTPQEVSTLASIVTSETRYEPEMPAVAGVYLNRLARGMKLQADPTVAFCFGYEPRRILLRHLEVDSPYNTYKYAGLPPGPICVSEKAALEAVLHPDRDKGWLYFCASPAFDGTHRFAASYDEHLRNARAFQSALDAARR